MLVPGRFTLAHLHNIIQAAMGWEESVLLPLAGDPL